jgi:hypothetical protein
MKTMKRKKMNRRTTLTKNKQRSSWDYLRLRSARIQSQRARVMSLSTMTMKELTR